MFLSNLAESNPPSVDYYLKKFDNGNFTENIFPFLPIKSIVDSNLYRLKYSGEKNYLIEKLNNDTVTETIKLNDYFTDNNDENLLISIFLLDKYATAGVLNLDNYNKFSKIINNNNIRKFMIICCLNYSFKNIANNEKELLKNILFKENIEPLLQAMTRFYTLFKNIYNLD